MKHLLLIFTLTMASTGLLPAETVDRAISDAVPTWVVAELFTSQGCSSCPPADEIFADLDTTVEDGVGILPLAFHVDYWDDIGWPDPFASPAWSARQLTYARAAGGNRIYTPQVVVNGQTETVGSDRRAVRRLLNEARSQPPSVSLELAVDIDIDTDSLAVMLDAVTVGSVAGAKGPGELELLIAVVDGGHVTKVPRGENRRRTLRDEHVVRQLDRVGVVATAEGSTERVRHRIAIDPSWQRDHLRVVVLAQDPRTRIIHGAAVWVDNLGRL